MTKATISPCSGSTWAKTPAAWQGLIRTGAVVLRRKVTRDGADCLCGDTSALHDCDGGVLRCAFPRTHVHRQRARRSG